MTATRFKALLLVLLICVLAGMLLAIGSPGVLSAGMTALSATSPEGSAAAQSNAEGSETAAATEQVTEAAATMVAASHSAPAATDEEDPWFSAIETVYISPDQDHWDYTSPTLGIEIKKVDLEDPVRLVYYTAEVRVKEGVALAPCFAGGDTSGKTRRTAEEIAQQSKAVLAVTADGFTGNRYKKGTVIRNGELLFEKGAADTLAVLPDGALTIFTPSEAGAGNLLALGVQNTFSYGPTLVRNGALNGEINTHRLAPRSARAGIGMIEPGHWVFIVADGCSKQISAGATLSEYAELFRGFGCVQAYNLEGGSAAAICFMGEQLNGLPGRKKARVADVIGVGRSELAEQGQ